MGADPDDAALVSVPPYHIAGIAAVLSSVWSGRRLVYLPQFSAEAWVDLAAAQAVTHAMVVPTMLGRILEVLDERDEQLPALRHLSYGGGRMPMALVERALDQLPHVGLVNAYGLTETSSTIAVLGPEDHREAIASTRSRGAAPAGLGGPPAAHPLGRDPRPPRGTRRGGHPRGDLGQRRAGLRGVPRPQFRRLRRRLAGHQRRRLAGPGGLPLRRGPPRRRDRARRGEPLARRDRRGPALAPRGGRRRRVRGAR